MVGFSVTEIIKIALRAGLVVTIAVLSIVISCQRQIIQRKERQYEQLQRSIERCENNLSAEKELVWFVTSARLNDGHVEAEAVDNIIEATSSHIERMDALKKLERAGAVGNASDWLDERVPADVRQLFSNSSGRGQVCEGTTSGDTVDALSTSTNTHENEQRPNRDVISDDRRTRDVRSKSSSIGTDL